MAFVDRKAFQVVAVIDKYLLTVPVAGQIIYPAAESGNPDTTFIILVDAIHIIIAQTVNIIFPMLITCQFIALVGVPDADDVVDEIGLRILAVRRLDVIDILGAGSVGRTADLLRADLRGDVDAALDDLLGGILIVAVLAAALPRIAHRSAVVEGRLQFGIAQVPVCYRS